MIADIVSGAPPIVDPRPYHPGRFRKSAWSKVADFGSTALLRRLAGVPEHSLHLPSVCSYDLILLMKEDQS
ncbi:Oxidoreductase, FAD-binding [Pseudomonas savastanoi]|nr:Oxidoreductase, FAD-binding [Pseudomonas savastanoi]